MDKRWTHLFCLSLIGIGAPAALVHAHVKMLKPAPWVVEDALGNPQKSGPCGPAQGATPMTTGMVTTYHVGEEISVEWTETIAHPGHFRIAVVEDRAQLKDPELALKDPAAGCDYDETKLPTPQGNVLADGMNFRPVGGPARPRQLSATVKLPDKPCEKCTLQLIQWMESHPPPCVYYHCADIKILPAGAVDPGAAGAGAPTGAAANAAAGASATAGAPAAMAGTGVTAPAAESSGCSVARPGAQDAGALALVASLALVAIAFLRRRRQLQ